MALGSPEHSREEPGGMEITKKEPKKNVKDRCGCESSGNRRFSSKRGSRTSPHRIISILLFKIQNSSSVGQQLV